MRKAFITGITGQDGFHLSDLLIAKGYEVSGLTRRNKHEATGGLAVDVRLFEGDVLDERRLAEILRAVQPDEIYNLAAQSFVPVSWQRPVQAADCNALGVVRLLEAMRESCPGARLCQASSSEIFGRGQAGPVDETTPCRPDNPYGAAKLYAHNMVANYRSHYGLFACSAILFNHEGPRRGPEFLTRKISRAVAEIECGLVHEVRLGNLQARRDWGFAGDVVEAMWLMLQQDTPDDFVIGTGESHSVQDFVELAFAHADRDWRQFVVVDAQFYRPNENPAPLADARKARAVLGWRPRLTFAELVRLMVDADRARLRSSADNQAYPTLT